jgi:hypothetical protein
VRGSQYFQDKCRRGFSFFEKLIIPDTYYAESERLQFFFACSIIGCLFRVLAAVEFDDQLSLQTDEIHDVTAQGVLAAKFETRKIVRAQ